jgi:hypothetical protein
MITFRFGCGVALVFSQLHDLFNTLSFPTDRQLT